MSVGALPSINLSIDGLASGYSETIIDPLAAIRARRAALEESRQPVAEQSEPEQQIVDTYYSETLSDADTPPSVNIVMDGITASTTFLTDRTENTTSETSQGSIRRRRGESPESEASTEVTEDSVAFEALLKQLSEHAAGLPGDVRSSLPEEGSDSRTQSLLQAVAASLPKLEAEQVDPTDSAESTVQESKPRAESLDVVA